MNGAAIDPYVVAGIVAVLATCVGGLIWVIKFLFQKLLPRLDNGNIAITRLEEAVKLNTKATKYADTYLRDRNGRDTELAKVLVKTTEKSHREIIDAISKIPEQIRKSAKEVPGQHITAQIVDEQIVKDNK